MKPLFTLHAGELLVGEHIERTFRNVYVWLPSRDTGVDLLVTDKRLRRCVSIQVKFSRDFLVTHASAEYQRDMRALGWWTINRAKLAASPAQYWVFALLGFASRSKDFVIVPRNRLLSQLTAVYGRQSAIQIYLTVTERGRCWNTRGLDHKDMLRVANGTFRNPNRELTAWLNNWEPVRKLDR
jgi:hypothetical protein